ncbi:hypothetical protein M378DRAFT_172307 [Amanita muscaria Koide BX008]|uniref:Uncharacterized protein n=1 Tax=Amanita muscaria (strain Koide BX008) TaxID=946122 RepID=A0A0C2SSA9_AMAMK|nr:hypothetical protein M378DRAFT_172307 [Amanita muscaria Koide BX008]
MAIRSFQIKQGAQKPRNAKKQTHLDSRYCDFVFWGLKISSLPWTDETPNFSSQQSQPNGRLYHIGYVRPLIRSRGSGKKNKTLPRHKIGIDSQLVHRNEGYHWLEEPLDWR